MKSILGLVAVVVGMLAPACSAGGVRGTDSNAAAAGGSDVRPVNPLGAACGATTPSDCDPLRAAATKANLADANGRGMPESERGKRRPKVLDQVGIRAVRLPALDRHPVTV